MNEALNLLTLKSARRGVECDNVCAHVCVCDVCKSQPSVEAYIYASNITQTYAIYLYTIALGNTQFRYMEFESGIFTHAH